MNSAQPHFSSQNILGSTNDESEEEAHSSLPSKHYVFSKRIFDLAFALFILPFLFPLMLIISILIKLDSRGPVFFRHERVGFQGKKFKCYKFRTMVQNAEELLKEVLKDPKIKQEWDKDFKLKQDPRITRMGKLLRKTSLDELPQFFNVILGEMSFVGPRPITETEIKLYQKDYDYYQNSIPGITGLWQVNGRSNTSYQMRVDLDKKYFFEKSFFLDLIIILKTIPEVLKKRGAY